MRKPAAITSFFALIFCQLGVTATAADTRPKPDYAVETNPYLPIQSLHPIY